MTHFVGAVLVPAGTRDEQGYLESVLERYSEERTVDPYVNQEYSDEEYNRAFKGMTEILDQWKQREREGTLRPWEAKNEPTDITGMSKLEVLRTWGGDWREDADGVLREYTTYNPESEWDWWVVGGRWDGEFAPGNHLPVADAIDELQSSDPAQWKFPYSLVNAEGEWITKGAMGWFGIAAPAMTDLEWQEKFLEELRKQPDGMLVFVDFHI